MWKLWFGVVLFAGPHLYSLLLPAARDGLKAKLGEKPYKIAYSLASLAGVILLALGYLEGRSGPASLDAVYEPFYNLKHLTYLLTLLGFILIGASHGKGYIKTYVRHPMSLGIVLWSVGHLLLNGETTVVIIFLVFLVLGVLDIILSQVRGKGPSHQPRLRSDLVAIVVGVVLWLVLALGFHPYVLNIPVA